MGGTADALDMTLPGRTYRGSRGPRTSCRTSRATPPRGLTAGPRGVLTATPTVVSMGPHL
ncbi:hypothetical protein GCM10027456_50370 [Kineosporia babensis]